jgi:hypothetical protein
MPYRGIARFLESLPIPQTNASRLGTMPTSRASEVTSNLPQFTRHATLACVAGVHISVIWIG